MPFFIFHQICKVPIISFLKILVSAKWDIDCVSTEMISVLLNAADKNVERTRNIKKLK